MDGFRIFTFNNKTFPNPKRLNDFAHSIHFKTVYMIDPGVKVDKGYSVYDQLVANKGYVLNKKSVVGEKDQDASTSLAVQVSATSSQSEVNQPLAMIDNDHATYWLSNISDKHPAAIVDLGANSEILNIGIEWHSIHFPVDYTIETSNDKTSWKLFNSIKNQKTGGFVEVPYKEQTQARYVRISSRKFAKKANEQIGIHTKLCLMEILSITIIQICQMIWLEVACGQVCAPSQTLLNQRHKNGGLVFVKTLCQKMKLMECGMI